MIPVTQTKVVVKNSNDNIVVHGNCYAAVVASILELPITEVPNVEVFFHFPINDNYWLEVMLAFLDGRGYELSTNDQFRVYHDGNYGINEGKRLEWMNNCKDKFYLVTGQSVRGFSHICIYQNGKMIHDPHPSKDGLITEEIFQEITNLVTL